MKLSLSNRGTDFHLARIWDLITDPIMGIVIDRFESRWGRRKHWVALVNTSTDASYKDGFYAGSRRGYALVLMLASLVLYVGYTMLTISTSLGGGTVN